MTTVRGTSPRVRYAGERCAHDCADCGEPMFWTESAVRTPDLLARSAPDAASTIPYVNAYRCGNGHTSQECPLCGSFDTAAWRDPAPSSHYHVICAACGNDALVTR